DITPGQQACPTNAGSSSLPEGNHYELFPPLSVSDIADMDSEDNASGKWHPVKSTRKRQRQKQGSSTSSSTVHLSRQGTTSRSTESLTVIFTSNKPDQIITTLGSLKISTALEKLCPECIIEVRVNDRLNLIAVDTRNGQTTRALLNCTSICGLKVTAYEPLSRSTAIGVIRDVDSNLSDAEITENIRSTVRIIRLRRLGTSESVKINFAGTELPSHVLLGHVRHSVAVFKDRPIQCKKCSGFGHRAIACKRPPGCSRCGENHVTTGKEKVDCTDRPAKCLNCKGSHEATSPLCPRWKHEQDILAYAKNHDLSFPSAKSALQQLKQGYSAETNPQPVIKPTDPPLVVEPSKKVEVQKTPRTPRPGIPYAAALAKQEPNIPVIFAKTKPNSEPSRTVAERKQEPRQAKENTAEKEADTVETTWTSIMKLILNLSCNVLASIAAPWAQTTHSILTMLLTLFTT
ncbi:unnamed protein product, partial [Ixodes hexagonus]